MPSPSLRRRSLLLAGGLLPLAATLRAQGAWPARPIRVVIPYPPGGAGDIVGRLFTGPLQSLLGQPIVIENKAGGGQVIGTAAVAKAAPDGYTLLLATTTHAINPGLHGKLPYDTLADFTPIAGVANSPLLLVASPTLGVSNVHELVARAKAAPGRINFGSAGLGSGGHLAVELLKDMAGIDLTHVPFSGAAPALNALLGGHVQVVCTSPLAVMNMVKEGRLRALAVTSPARAPQWPEIPTVAESGYAGYRATLWYALLGPARLPAAIVARLNAAANEALTAPALREQLHLQGADIQPGTPEAIDAFVREEIQRYSGVIERAHIARI
jgi:tripartite-type tricarboxylate transporter receptor subunit TctC